MTVLSRAKLFGGKGLDVLQSKLEPFEDFLVRLLQKPNLKKSDLLFTFLTSKQEFNEAASQLGLSRYIYRGHNSRGLFGGSDVNDQVIRVHDHP